MATTKSVTKAASGKRAAAVAVTSAAKAKPAPKTKPATKPEPVAKAKAAAKAVPVMPVNLRAKKPAGVPLEQRRNYIEVAAYHIAECRDFAPGNPLEDWVQAEAEIDRLIAKGLLGS